MNSRLLLLAAVLAAPAQALELGQPEIHLEPDCTVLLTVQLATEAGVDPDQMRVEIASPPTYRKLGKTYPSWAGSAQLKRIKHGGEDRVQVRSTEPLPSHSNDLVLAIGESYESPMFYTLNLPPCDPAGTMRKVVWGDTLLEIALEHSRPLEVDAYTLMLAIQLYNRDAFIHDNINLVRAGTRLYIPSEAEIALLNLSRQWLVDEIRFQNEQWQQWRREGTDLRESPTLQERRLQLVPLEMQAEPAAPASEQAGSAESGTTDAQPAVPGQIEPEPAESGPTPSAPVEPETEPSAMAKFRAKILAPLTDWLGGEPATPEPTVPEPNPAEPPAPESSALEPTKAEPAEPGTTGAQPAVPTEPEPAASEPSPAAPAEPEAEKTEAPSAMAEFKAKILAPLTDWLGGEPATPEPTVPEPDPAEPAAPEPSALEPTKAEPAEPGTTGAQPAVPTEPEPATSEPPPAAPAEPEAEKTEAPPAMVEIEPKVLMPLTNRLGGEGAVAKIAADLPWPGILAAAGILLLAYLFALVMRRVRHARIIQQSVGDIEDPARRATSALDLAHAHIEADEYDQARPLVRLVLAEGTEQEREEAEKLKGRIAPF